MDAVTERALIARALIHLDAPGADHADGEMRLPVSFYTDEARFAAEQRTLFRRHPLFIAASASLSRPGDFLTRDRHGLPILATRAEDGRARVFLDVCLHRGTRLTTEPSGCDRTSFVCPYHAWSYALDGRLLGINQAHAFPETSRERPRLVELPSLERFGMLWATLDPAAAAPDPAFFGLASELEALGRAYPIPFEPDTGLRRANWKVFVDGGLETYHFRIAHHTTISPYFHDDILIRDRFGPHQRLVLPRRTLRAAPAPVRLREHANIVYFLFPNLTLLVQADHMVAIHVTPQAVGESSIEVTMFIPPTPLDAKSRAYWAKNRAITLDVLEQDFSVGERAQLGMASGAIASVRLGRQEVGIADFHADVARALQA
jgi:phenylpropionate dioxygenase-like ring-hydroxylating dioxygenase large terminal subunit